MPGLDLSPDGRTLAFLEQDGTLRWVDTPDPAVIAPVYDAPGHDLAGDQFSFDDVGYSPDGTRLAVGGEGPAVLDARSHELVAGLQLDGDQLVGALRFSRDGRTVFAVVSYFDSTLNPATSIERFDAATGRQLGRARVVSRREVAHVNLMPTHDGRRLVVASAQEPTQILDARTLEPVALLPVRADRAALGPDDHTMLTGGADGRCASSTSPPVRSGRRRAATALPSPLQNSRPTDAPPSRRALTAARSFGTSGARRRARRSEAMPARSAA